MQRMTAVLAVVLLSACAAPVKEQPRAGFLSDYSQLEKQDDETYVFLNEALADYDAFLIEPVQVLFEQDPETAKFTKEQLDELAEYFAEELAEALSDDDGYAIAEENGPGVARARMAITHVDDSIGILNLSIYTKITGAGLGGVAIEGEVVDSQTGEQLWGTVRWGSGSRILRAGLTETGDAKILLKRWSKELRKRLDEQRGS